MYDIQKVREDFPILDREVYGKPVSYTHLEKEEDDVFKIRPTEFKSKINVVGQIDLYIVPFSPG